MKIVTSEFQKTVENIINTLKIEDFPDSEEFNLARKYNALPLGFGIFTFTFITSDGEVIWHDFLDNVGKFKDSQSLINALVVGKKRYPQLEQFIPNRSDESKTCPVCKGTGFWKESKDVVTGEPGKCVFCGSLGWVTEEFWKNHSENLKS